MPTINQRLKELEKAVSAQKGCLLAIVVVDGQMDSSIGGQMDVAFDGLITKLRQNDDLNALAKHKLGPWLLPTATTPEERLQLLHKCYAAIYSKPMLEKEHITDYLNKSASNAEVAMADALNHAINVAVGAPVKK